MKRLLIPLILFFLLILEGIALEILPASLLKSDFVFVSHWVFVFLVPLAVHYDREDTYFSVFYGLLFGLLIDIVYTDILGVYMFSYALSAYMVHGMSKMLHANFLVTAMLGMAGIILVELFINIIYAVTGVAELVWHDYLIYRLLPTVMANMLCLFILYPIFRKRLVRWKEDIISGAARF